MTPHDRQVAEALKIRLSTAAPSHLRKVMSLREGVLL